MRTETRAASAIFAANRAQGAVRFDVRCDGGVTRRGRLHEFGSLRVRFPSPEGDGLSAVFVNTAGGVAGGDHFDIAIVLVEQYLDFACELGDNFAVMDRGGVKYSCTRENLDQGEISRQMAL